MANTDKFPVDSVQFWFFALILTQRYSAIKRAKSQNAILIFFTEGLKREVCRM